MPLLLTTPKSTGDLDSANATYSEAKIIRQSHDSVNKTFEVVVQLGNTISNIWVPGVIAPKRFSLMDLVGRVDGNGDPIADELHYTDIALKSMQDAGLTVTDRIYDGAAYHLYQWLVDQGYYTGTYV